MPKAEVTAAPTAEKTQSNNWQPHEVDPDLATAKMAENLIEKMGPPSVISTPFVVRYGIFSGLNHTESNPTGYNCGMRLSLYRKVAHESVNVNGMYFEHIWQYLMKPKVVVQGLANQPAFEQEEKTSIWDKLTGWFRGGKKDDTTSSKPNN